jgi:hypothetical protein
MESSSIDKFSLKVKLTYVFVQYIPDKLLLKDNQ